MKAFIFSKSFILPAIVAITIACSSMVAFHEAPQVNSKSDQCSGKAPSRLNGEILWDKVAKHFSTLFFI